MADGGTGAKISRIEEFLRRRALALPRGPESLQYLLRCGETFANRLDPDCGDKLAQAVFSAALRAHRDVGGMVDEWRDAPAGYAQAEKRYSGLLLGEEVAPWPFRLSPAGWRRWDVLRSYWELSPAGRLVGAFGRYPAVIRWPLRVMMLWGFARVLALGARQLWSGVRMLAERLGLSGHVRGLGSPEFVTLGGRLGIPVPPGFLGRFRDHQAFELADMEPFHLTHPYRGVSMWDAPVGLCGDRTRLRVSKFPGPWLYRIWRAHVKWAIRWALPGLRWALLKWWRLVVGAFRLCYPVPLPD